MNNYVYFRKVARLTDREWQTPQRFLKTFSPAAAFPEAFFFLAPMSIFVFHLINSSFLSLLTLLSDTRDNYRLSAKDFWYGNSTYCSVHWRGFRWGCPRVGWPRSSWTARCARSCFCWQISAGFSVTTITLKNNIVFLSFFSKLQICFQRVRHRFLL